MKTCGAINMSGSTQPRKVTRFSISGSSQTEKATATI